MRMLRRLIYGAVLLWCLGNSCTAGTVAIVATGDMHGDLKALAHLAPVLRDWNEAVKIDLGDLFQGCFPVREARGVPMIEALNMLGFELFVPGNHDFEYDGADFALWAKLFRGKIAGEWSFDGFTPVRQVVVSRRGYRIGIIALTERRLAAKSRFYPRLQCADAVTSVRRSIEKLTAAKCDAIVLACHIPVQGNYGDLYRILQSAPEIDAVIGGHSHRECPGMIVAGRLALQPGARGKAAALLEIDFDADRRVAGCRGRSLRPVKNADPEIISLFDRMETHISAAKEFRSEKFTAAGFGSYAAEVLRRKFDADAAIFTFNRNYFPARLNRRTLYRLLPFSNRVVIAEISPEQLREISGKLDVPPRMVFTAKRAGTENKKLRRVVMSDFIAAGFLCATGAKVSVKRDFERETIAASLEKSL